VPITGAQADFQLLISARNPLLTWKNDTVRPKIARVYDYYVPAWETLTM
jgi:hypothetical protein